MQRTHGYAPAGQRIHGLTYGKRKGRTNIIGAWSHTRKLFATETYETTIRKETFLDWIKSHLLQHLKAGVAVIMDNAPWHKGNDIRKLIEQTGAKLIFLAPYSPDLNPIEHAWANLKQAVRANKRYFHDISDNIRAQIKKMNRSNSD